MVTPTYTSIHVNRGCMARTKRRAGGGVVVCLIISVTNAFRPLSLLAPSAPRPASYITQCPHSPCFFDAETRVFLSQRKRRSRPADNLRCLYAAAPGAAEGIQQQGGDGITGGWAGYCGTIIIYCCLASLSISDLISASCYLLFQFFVAVYALKTGWECHFSLQTKKVQRVPDTYLPEAFVEWDVEVWGWEGCVYDHLLSRYVSMYDTYRHTGACT